MLGIDSLGRNYYVCTVYVAGIDHVRVHPVAAAMF